MSASSATQVSQKRRRADEGAQACPPLNEMTKDETLWYSDGNIVVGAGKNLFRVHKSVLSRHSVVFGDMFGGPPHAGEEVDGCPFMRLFGDNPAEVRCMLNEMYGLRARSSRKVSLVLLCALVRLGEKYDIPAMREEGAGIMRELYGLDLFTFQQRQPSSSSHLFGGPVDPSSRADFPVSPWKREYCFDVYVLARDHGTKRIAASALYDCCRWPLVNLKTETIPALDPDVLWACALGRELLAKQGAVQLLKLDPKHVKITVTTGLFGDSGPGCQQEQVCGHALEKNFETIKAGMAPARLDPIAPTFNDAYVNQLKKQLCVSCGQKVIRALQNDAQAIWDALPDTLSPAIMGLPV
ncbi:hypothetical protein PENSPDRAFT_351973 [Peniophora sp. CONT]|nr:hypothetical protein PENSPDRAFT_351973 [Peniophora sp. CONT]